MINNHLIDCMTKEEREKLGSKDQDCDTCNNYEWVTNEDGVKMPCPVCNTKGGGNG